MTEYDTRLYYFKNNASDLVLYKMTVRVRVCIATLLDAVETEDVDPAPMFGTSCLRRIAAARDPRPKCGAVVRKNHEAPSSSKLAAKPRSETFGKSAVRSPQESRESRNPSPYLSIFSCTFIVVHIY